jgi:hypothetical protein
MCTAPMHRRKRPDTARAAVGDPDRQLDRRSRQQLAWRCALLCVAFLCRCACCLRGGVIIYTHPSPQVITRWWRCMHVYLWPGRAGAVGFAAPVPLHDLAHTTMHDCTTNGLGTHVIRHSNTDRLAAPSVLFSCTPHPRAVLGMHSRPAVQSSAMTRIASPSCSVTLVPIAGASSHAAPRARTMPIAVALASRTHSPTSAKVSVSPASGRGGGRRALSWITAYRIPVSAKQGSKAMLPRLREGISPLCVSGWIAPSSRHPSTMRRTWRDAIV